MNTTQICEEITTLIKSQTNIINSTQTFRRYVSDCKRKGINNEESVVQPFIISMLKSLNYINQHNLTIEEAQKGNKPDFHSSTFILEYKSTKYKNFSEKYGRDESPEEQLKRYLESTEFSREFGLIFSLDKLYVYKLVDGELHQINELSFSLVDFFENKASNIDKFISKFYIKPITLDEKLRIIANTQRKELIPIHPKSFNTVLKALIKEISLELDTAFVGLDDRDDDTKLIRNKVCQIKKQMDLKTTNEAEKEYIYQTSYIILARIILTKSWEDLELIDPPNTYNGGFKKYIQDYHEKIIDVYKKALDSSQKIYFLFNPDNPYLILPLSEGLIVDILFQLCKYNFNTLDYDILGYIYEDYLDLEHRKKFGQYYTPPYVVNLILDRIGYKPLPNILLDDSILDPASGSGTFLLNAVRRVLQSKHDGRDHALEYKQIIENNIFGSELMLFPYLISEINILIQFSQELKKVIQKGKNLNVFHVFPNNSFNLIDKTIATRIFNLPEDEIKGDKIIDSAIIKRKEDKLTFLQHKVDFDYVVGNPPYVANDTNPELFREMREFFTFCNETYHNKMDLFYWFIILGILKLKPGGKLGFITTRYWLDKGEKTGVETLKKYILDNCEIKEVIDLRNLTVFVSATGQENVIFILQRKEKTIQQENIRIFRIQPRPEKGLCMLNPCIFDRGYCTNDQEYLECLCKLEPQWNNLLINKNMPLSKYIHAFYSAKFTSDLNPSRSWDIFYPGEGIIKEIMDSIVESCSQDIKKVDVAGNPYVEKGVIKYVKDFFLLRVGVLTTIDEVFIIIPNILKIEKDKYLLKIENSIKIKRSEKQKLVTTYGGIIDNSGYVWLELSDIEKKRLMNLYKTPSVYRHGLDISKIVGKLIFFEDERLYNKCPVLIMYLAQYKDEIIKKLEEYEELTPTRPNKWITLRRSHIITLPDRTRRPLYGYYHKKPKIFYNYRVGNDNIFGFSNKHMVAATDMYFFHKYGENINIYYILAYLNSKIISFYFKERPIELQRQKSNVENDIPIFLPRNESESILQKVIIQKERILIRKLQKLERHYRLKGFHFELGISSEDEIKIDVETFLQNIEIPTIQDLSYRITGELEIYTIDRKSFPILLLNPYKIKKLGLFKEITSESNVHFQYKTFKLIVHQKIYDKIKVILDSFFEFEDSQKTERLLQLRIPNDTIMEIIKIQKSRLYNKIATLTSDEKNQIEQIIDDILKDGNITKTDFINSISKILYFINISFIKMMVPQFKDEILAYS
ncbi:MAG: N-6 DNA methylase [Promethearchaeota archaeon]